MSAQTYKPIATMITCREDDEEAMVMLSAYRELERENAALRRALADALSTFHHEDEVIVTAERVEAWKAALTNGGQP